MIAEIFDTLCVWASAFLMLALWIIVMILFVVPFRIWRRLMDDVLAFMQFSNLLIVLIGIGAVLLMVSRG
jgi:hypothetical protein